MNNLKKLIDHLEAVKKLLLDDEELNNLVANHKIFKKNLSESVASLKDFEISSNKASVHIFINELKISNILKGKELYFKDVIIKKYKITNWKLFIDELEKQLKFQSLF